MCFVFNVNFKGRGSHVNFVLNCFDTLGYLETFKRKFPDKFTGITICETKLNWESQTPRLKYFVLYDVLHSCLIWDNFVI